MKTIVLGPPGTGKTTTLLNKVDDYLKETDPDKVGYFAFTQKAAYEARDRADSKEEAIKIALKNGYQWDTDDLCTEESGLEEITAQHIDTIWEEDDEY